MSDLSEIFGTETESGNEPDFAAIFGGGDAADAPPIPVEEPKTTEATAEAAVEEPVRAQDAEESAAPAEAEAQTEPAEAKTPKTKGKKKESEAEQDLFAAFNDQANAPAPPTQQTASASSSGQVSLFDKAPIFSYGSAKEPIEDGSITFEDLRIKKSEDFPELESGKTVSWRVKYGAVINRASKTSSGQVKRRRRLNKIARLLDDTPIEKLSERQMSTLCQMLGKNWAEYFKDASELLAYALGKRRDGVGCDPFAAYSERHAPRKKKDSAALQEEAKRQRTLTASQDDALLAQILAHPENGALIGVALSRWAGMSSREVCELKLSAIQPMKEAPELMYIDFHIEKNAGATHNYSFPALPPLTEIIKARRTYLAKQGIDEKGLRAASADDDPTKALQPKQLTDTCRIVTIGLGVENGAGIGLLQESYHQNLLNCGFIGDQQTGYAEVLKLLRFVPVEIISDNCVRHSKDSFPGMKKDTTAKNAKSCLFSGFALVTTV